MYSQFVTQESIIPIYIFEEHHEGNFNAIARLDYSLIIFYK